MGAGVRACGMHVCKAHMCPWTDTSIKVLMVCY